MGIKQHGHPELGNPEKNCWCRSGQTTTVPRQCACRLGHKCDKHRERAESNPF